MDSVFENNVLLTQTERLMMPADRKSRSMQAEYENVVLKPSEYQQDMVVSLAERAEGEAGNDKSKGCRRRNRKAYATKDKGKRRNL